jgi:hypothetical protein
MNRCGARSGVVKGNGSCQSKCHARGFEAWFQDGRSRCWNFGACYVLSTFISSGFTIIHLAVANTVVVTDTVTPNALLIVSACLRGIARKITFASKRLAVSQLQLLCSVLCSCILFFVFIINYSLIEFISFSYFLFL